MAASFPRAVHDFGDTTVNHSGQYTDTREKMLVSGNIPQDAAMTPLHAHNAQILGDTNNLDGNSGPALQQPSNTAVV